jgi:predicted nucleic acid-binding Zn ribbon protein
MSCRHDQGLAARWDHLSEDEASGSGWIVCRSCGALLQRLTIAGGKFRGRGQFLAAFREQISQESPFSALPELEVD